jgi:hypothetical protein
MPAWFTKWENYRLTFEIKKNGDGKFNIIMTNLKMLHFLAAEETKGNKRKRVIDKEYHGTC